MNLRVNMCMHVNTVGIQVNGTGEGLPPPLTNGRQRVQQRDRWQVFKDLQQQFNRHVRCRTCHYDESSKCAHVSINEVACYRTIEGGGGGGGAPPRFFLVFPYILKKSNLNKSEDFFR